MEIFQQDTTCIETPKRTHFQKEKLK
uniref:Uncharacterized protein n=1 Tax=Anguilla anguilla TaxID=7936 RepID=A0A0E9RZL1_ANGAN